MKKEIIARQLVKIAKELTSGREWGFQLKNPEQYKKIIQYFQKRFSKYVRKATGYQSAARLLNNNNGVIDIILLMDNEAVVFYYIINFSKMVRKAIPIHNVEQLKKAINEFGSILKKQIEEYNKIQIKNFDNKILEVEKKLNELKDSKRNFEKNVNELYKTIQSFR